MWEELEQIRKDHSHRRRSMYVWQQWTPLLVWVDDLETLGDLDGLDVKRAKGELYEFGLSG